jgi:hypothetical protein
MLLLSEVTHVQDWWCIHVPLRALGLSISSLELESLCYCPSCSYLATSTCIQEDPIWGGSPYLDNHPTPQVPLFQGMFAGSCVTIMRQVWWSIITEAQKVVYVASQYILWEEIRSSISLAFTTSFEWKQHMVYLCVCARYITSGMGPLFISLVLTFSHSHYQNSHSSDTNTINADVLLYNHTSP